MTSSGRNTALSDVSSINHDRTEEEEEVKKLLVNKHNSGPWSLQRAITVYRLKYVCAQPCSVFLKSVLSRIPSGKKVYVMLLMMGLEQLAYSASSDYLIYPFLSKVGIDDVNLVRSVVTYIIGFLMFPVMGWVADVWVGQYHMIHFSLWLLWLGYAALALVYSFCMLDTNQTAHYTLPLLFAAITVGHTGFQASAIPYGAEVIKYRTSQELSSYFHCYYWIRNLGFTLFFVTANCSSLKQSLQGAVYCLVAVVCISLALVLNGLFRRWFNVKWESINPYKKVLQVLYLAMVIKRPVHRSAFSFTGAKPPSRLSLTKEVHGGKFSSEEVEDVKTFLRLLSILFCILMALIIYTEIYQVIPTQLHDMGAHILTSNFTIRHLGSCEFSDKFAIATNVALILPIIPILNFVLYPFLREYMPNMLKRIGVGIFFAMLAQVSILAVSGAGVRRRGHDVQQCMFSTDFSEGDVPEGYEYSRVSEFYALVPHVLITIAEVFINVTSLEFFYAQSPHRMRGMMVGLFFFMWGLSTAIARFMMFSFGYSKSTTHMTCDFWYYLLYLFVAVLGFACYVMLAQRYRNRQRGEQDSDLFYRRPSHYQTD